MNDKFMDNLSLFMRKAEESLGSFTGLETKAVSYTLKEFDVSLSDIKESISAVMKFHGEIEGVFTLVFPKEIVNETLEVVFQEKQKFHDEYKIDTLKDGVAEFCNIITGAIKTELSLKGVKVVFDLPQTYDSVAKIDMQRNDGMCIKMQLQENPFYIFITNPKVK